MRFSFLFIFFCVALQAQSTNEWTIEANHIEASNYYGVTIGNGMLGIVSSPTPFRVGEVVLHGAYDLYGRGRVSNFIRGLSFLDWNLFIDGELLGTHNIEGMQQQLDMRNGSFTVRFRKKDKAIIKYTYYALRHLPYNALVKIEITPLIPISIVASSIISAPDALREVENYFNEIDRPHAHIPLLTSTAMSPTGKLLFAASTTFIHQEPHKEQPRIIHEMWDNNRHWMKFSKVLKPNETYSFSIVGSTMTNVHHDDPLNEVERMTIYAQLEGEARLLQKHNDAWSSLWESDIIIEGDGKTQKEVRSMLYHLYAFMRQGTAYSPSPMGLSGLGYNGHVFWDTELWMFPPMLLLHHEIAKGMLEYRYQRLAQAKHNAFAHGYKGAMFPWESAESGNEETPVWALTGPFEHHITACVAIAAWNYYAVTQDKEWLRARGFPLLREIANFWSSRVERNEERQYDILNVVAADEWAENVDNDAFTNAAARASLSYATKAAHILGKTPDPDWEHVRKNIPILYFENGIVREHATYNGEPIKQADVNLLSFPLEEIKDAKAIKRNVAYYESRVGHGPAMTQAIYSILYSRLGDPSKALEMFHKGYRPNLLPPFGVIAESAGGTNPYFATGAGGMLQAMLFGFGGLDIDDGGLRKIRNIPLPPTWKKLTLKGIGVDKKVYTSLP